MMRLHCPRCKKIVAVTAIERVRGGRCAERGAHVHCLDCNTILYLPSAARKAC